jgi:hypothetical protein
VRNSVKAVVDAYTGDVTFYVVDEQDPILRAWRGAFPDLFTSLTRCPRICVDNLRYPEDLFRIQTDVYSKYRIAPTSSSSGWAPGRSRRRPAPSRRRRWRRRRRAPAMRRSPPRRAPSPTS